MAEYSPGQPMEDILASIKKIIVDGPPPKTVKAAVDPTEEVLELGEPLPEPVAPPVAAEPVSAPEVESETLVSSAAALASRQALAALSSVSVDPAADANTLDGLVRELLRPMLKQWLDQNLPDMVERLVAREIARLGGR